MRHLKKVLTGIGLLVYSFFFVVSMVMVPAKLRSDEYWEAIFWSVMFLAMLSAVIMTYQRMNRKSEDGKTGKK